MQCFKYRGKKVFLLLCLTRVSSCSYVSQGAMEKSKLRSSRVENHCVDWFCWVFVLAALLLKQISMFV